MATGSQCFNLRTSDLEEIVEFHCSTCAEKGNILEAKKYCQNCAVYLCDECLEQHSKFPALRNHVTTDIVNTIQPNSSEIPLQEDKLDDKPACAHHHDNLIIRFCKRHDDVCCKVCIAVKHRSCELIEISKAAEHVKSSKEFVEKRSSLESILTSLKEMITKRNISILKVNDQKKGLLTDVEKYEEELIARIRELGSESRRQTETEYHSLDVTLRENSSAAEAVTACITHAQHLITSENDVQAFVHMKYCSSAIQEGKEFLKNNENNDLPSQPAFTINSDISARLHFVKSLLTDGKKVQNIETFIVQTNEIRLIDSDVGVISGMCILDNSDVLIADHNNSCLRRFNSILAEVTSLDLRTYPYGLCWLGYNEVATCVQNTVQFVSTANRTLQHKSELDISYECSAICYISSKSLLVLNSLKTVVVLDKISKEVVRLIDKPLHVTTDLTTARLFTFESSLNFLIMGGFNDSVLAINMVGQLQWMFSDRALKGARDACVLPGGVILVCGWESDNIVQLDIHGKMMGILTNNIEGPYSMVYDHKNSKVLVGCSGVLHVLTLVQD